MASKKNRRDKNEHPGNGDKKRASFGIEPLEKRVLMSASWVDADTGEAQDNSTEGADAFTGSDAADIAHGGGGNDLLEGLGGNDQLSGEEGSDTIIGGEGDDQIDGGAGDDTIHGDASQSEWFDETNGGDGYESFGDLAAAYETFENEAEHTISFESMSRGEKLGDQLAVTHGVTFENAESSIYNNYAGIQTEGGAIVENLTGYDGSYDADGSNVYLKFANNDPDAPFTVNFNEPVSEVGSMFAVGKEGDVHSVQVTVYDADGAVIGQKVVEPELWDETSSKQNYEGFFQFKSNEANISRVEILNLSQTQFSDALMIDNMAWSTAVEGGNDVITGGEGNDTIHAGGGDDVINYTVGDGVDVVDGSSGMDEIVIQGVPGEAANVLVEDGATYAERTGEAVGNDLVIVSVNGEKAIEAQNIEQITFNATTSEDTLEVSGSLAATGLDAGDVQFNAVELDLEAEPMSVIENAEAGTEVGSVNMANATNDAEFTYELADDAGGRFTIDSDGRVLVTEGADLNYEGQTSHEVTVRVTDADGETYEEVVDIALSNVEETFFLTGNQTLNASDGPFENVVINGGYLEINGDAVIKGDLIIENASRINGGELVVSGDVTTTDTSFHGSATIVLDGDGAQTISTGSGEGELHNVSITNASGEVSIEGDLQISGTYADNGNAVDASGSTVELQGNANVSGGSTSFGDVTVNGGYFEIASMDIDGDLTIERASRINGGDILVSGDVTTTDTSFHGSATIVLNGDGAQTISTGSGAGELHNVSITNASGEVSIEGDLQISGTYADNGNAVDASGATVELQGNANVSGGSTSFGDVTVNGGYFEIASMDIDGDLTIERASRINGGEILVSGDVTTSDTSFYGSATIVLDGDGAQTISTGSGTGELHNVSITNASGEVSIEGDLQISGTYADNGNAVDASGSTVELQGNANVSGGSTSFGDVTVNGGYFEIASMDIDGDLNIERASRINGGDILVSGDVTTSDTSFYGSATIVLDGDAAQTISTGSGTGELHNVSITNASGEVSIEGDLQISGTYADNGNAVDASGSTVELQGNANVSGGSTSFGDVTVNGGYFEIASMDIDGDLNIERASRINGGDILVSGDVTTSDTSFYGSATIVLDGEGAQTVSTGEGAGEIHRLSIGNTSGNVTVDGNLQISGTYADNGNAVDASGSTVELQGNASVSGQATNFGNMVINGGYMELDGDIYVRGDIEVQKLSRLNGGTIYVAGEISETDTSWYGTGDIQPWITNEAPTDIEFGGGTVSENAAAGTVVATASVVDPDAGDSHSYELVDDADGRFTIDADGHIAVADGADLNYEDAGAHEVTVRATDAEGETVERSLTIEVGDVNEIHSLDVSGGSVSENAPAGTEVASVNVSDADVGQTHSFELVSDGEGRFTIDSDGKITVAEGADLDHEQAASYDITVRVTDDLGESVEQSLTINVGDVNEAPTALSFSGGAVAENAAAGTFVASASVSDADAGDSHSYELVDDAQGRFSIDADGAITVAEGADLNHEGASSHTVTVRATDASGETIERELTINVGDVNEAPTALSFSGGSVAENAAAGTFVATASVSDADAGDTHSYELVDDAQGRFTIDAEGAITVAEGADLNHEGASSHTVTVRATDASGETIEQSLTINVGDVNEAPTEVTVNTNAVSEDTQAGTVVASIGVADVDDGDRFTFELTDDAGGLFVINPDGTITVAEDASLDFETATQHELRVLVTDEGGNTVEQTVTVNVTNANEAEAETADEEAEPVAEAQVRPEPTRAVGPDMPDDQPEADAQPAEVISNFVENDRDESEVGENNRTMQWVAEEIDEITQIAHSVDAADIPVSPEADSSDGTSFDEAFVFEDGDGSQLDSGEVLPEEDGRDERVSDGFLSKFWVMLRAGLGTTNKMDAGDSASSAQNAINKLRKRH